MSIVTVISRKLLSIILGIMALFKRAMCFLGRRRKNSGTLLPTANHYPNPMSANITQSVPGNEEVELESWDNWGQGDAPVNVSVDGMANNVNHYQTSTPGFYNNRGKNPEPEEEAPEVDFFQDMTPRFKRPKTVFVGADSSPKIMIRKKDEQVGNISSRLAMGSEIPQQNPELGSWEDTENAWDEAVGEDLSWEAEEAIREKRRQERERRLQEHQRKKIERDSQRLHKKDSGNLISAVKLS